MEQPVSPALTLRERLDFILHETGCQTGSALAGWAKTGTPQALSKAARLGKISRDAALKISAATGADLSWLIRGTGIAFPKGATPFPGANQSVPDNRVRQAEDQIDALIQAVNAVIRIVSAKQPEIGRLLAQSLSQRALEGRSGSMKQVLEAAADVAAQGLSHAESEARRVARPSPSEKHPRKGR